MKWKNPPPIKVYEALGAVVDGRVAAIDEFRATVASSSGNKSYDVIFNPKTHEISVNDNGSYYQGYLGYPALAYLMIKGLLPYDEILAQGLKGLPWKHINQENKNDFEKTIIYLHTLVDGANLEKYSSLVIESLATLELSRPRIIPKPPRGW